MSHIVHVRHFFILPYQFLFNLYHRHTNTYREFAFYLSPLSRIYHMNICPTIVCFVSIICGFSA